MITALGSLCVTVTNTHLPTLRMLHEAFAGSVSRSHRDGAGRPSFVWRAYGPTAAAFLRAVLPFLREKHAQAYLALAWLRSADRHISRDTMRRTLSALKRPVFHINEKGSP